MCKNETSLKIMLCKTFSIKYVQNVTIIPSNENLRYPYDVKQSSLAFFIELQEVTPKFSYELFKLNFKIWKIDFSKIANC